MNFLMMTRLLKMKSKSRTRLRGPVNEKLVQEAKSRKYLLRPCRPSTGTGVRAPRNPAAKTRSRVMGTESCTRYRGSTEEHPYPM